MDRHLAMETFIRVVDTGSFSAAASQMRVGQPAVSKAIAQLEEWLGVRLLLRSTRSLTPTEAGLNFYVRAKRSIEEAEEAVLAARGAGAALSGKLRIANRQASLEELGQLAVPPLTKDAIAGRIRRLLAMADRRAADQGIPSTEASLTVDMFP